MGAFPEEPEHFLQWLVAHDPHRHGEEFISRRLYGQYLQQLLADTAQQAKHHTLACLQEEAIELAVIDEGNTVAVAFSSGRKISADACVVAIGNLQRIAPETIEAKTLYRSPYHSSTYADLRERDSIVVIGSGLSAIDAIIEAEASGFSGSYQIISRHGRFPLAHEESPHTSVMLPDKWYELGSARQLLRLIRRLSCQIGSSQPVFEAMRPHIQQMWSNLSLNERRRFLRHARPIWDIHRHRTPREHHDLISSLKISGRLSIHSGRLVTADRTGDHVTIKINRKGIVRSIEASVAILCVGPEGNVSRIQHPFVSSILRIGHLKPSCLGLGFEELPNHSADRVFTIGPLQRHMRWEITAVRELREAAAQLAHQIGVSLELTRFVLD
jgi:uncharacterized NAD(P)/FAD-binding protein YdhS